MREQILAAVRQALAGSRKVRITFKPKGMPVTLMGMDNSKVVELSDGDKLLISTVVTFGWDRDRAMTIKLGEKFDETWFTDRLHRELEKIQVA